MKCYFAACDYPAAYFQLKAEKQWGLPDGPKRTAFQACECHGAILNWDLPESRKRDGVLTAEEFEVYRVHQE